MPDIQPIALRGLNNAAGRVAAAVTTIARAGTGLPERGQDPAADPAASSAAVITRNALAPQQLSAVGDDDLVSAAVDLKLGQAAYAANAAVIRSQDELERDFIRDIRI